MQNISSEQLRAYFNGRCCWDEAERIRMWFAQNAGSAEFDNALRVLWDEMPRTRDSVRSRRAFDQFCQHLGYPQKTQAPRMQIMKWAQRIAAVLVVPLLAATIYLNDQSSKPSHWVEEWAPYGKTREIVLPDDSRVWLNAGSKVIYPSRFNGRIRQVYLVGEAFLDVAHNSRKPFYVSLSNARIRVTGTKFNVKSYLEENKTEVSLVEGSVTLETDRNGEQKRYKMTPGTYLSVDHLTGGVDAYRFSAQEFQSWSQGGGLYFRNVPLGEIVRDLERRFDVQIVIRSESLRHEKYFASFVNNESLLQVLEALNICGEMRIVARDGVVDIYPAGKPRS